MTSHQLLIFVKAPRAGAVKTRLAESVGATAACAAYRTLVETLVKHLCDLREVKLCFTPDDAASEIRPWLRDGWSRAPQGDGDLGARLHRAFADVFAAGVTRAVVIGSDCPAVTSRDIEAAWRALATHDLVLGPARDGGYWLIGLRAACPALFEQMAWSTSLVLDETLRRAERLGLRAKLLRELADVDTATDWQEFLASAAAGTDNASR